MNRLVVAVAFAAAITLPSIGAFRSLQEPDQEPHEVTKVSEHSITADLSLDHRFTVRIGPNLGEFAFKIVPNLEEPDKYGNARTTIQGIEVFRDTATKPLQHLEGCDWSSSEPPPAADMDWFRTDDFNFDGYEDLYVETNWGATGNEYGCVWLYDPTSGRFNYSEEFSRLSRYWINPEKKIIFTFATGGGGNYVAERYRVENNRPVLMWSESREGTGQGEQFHCVVKKRRGQQMVTLRDTRALPGEMLPACDGDRFFMNPDTMWSER